MMLAGRGDVQRFSRHETSFLELGVTDRFLETFKVKNMFLDKN